LTTPTNARRSPHACGEACLLDPCRELEDYHGGGGNEPVARLQKEGDKDGGGDGLDSLKQEYGTDAADAIPEHLSLFHVRLDSASGGGY
jgi:hypothetical protein